MPAVAPAAPPCPVAILQVVVIGEVPLIVAGIGIARSLVLAVGVWIELRAIAGIVDHLLRRRRTRQRRGGK